MDTYRVPLGSRGVVNVSCGQMVEPGEESTRVDPTDPHDKALIEDGQLIKISSDESEIEVSDEAAKLAQEHDLDLSNVQGSGSGGNIVIDDVRKAIKDAEEEEEVND